jgi:hypothetical protein
MIALLKLLDLASPTAIGCFLTILIIYFMKDYHKPGYWKDWYWNKGGKEKVQYSKKVNQVMNKYNQERYDR